MAACIRTFAFLQLRSNFTVPRCERLRPVLANFNAIPRRSFVSRRVPDTRHVSKNGLLYYLAGGVAVGAAFIGLETAYSVLTAKNTAPIMNDENILSANVIESRPPFEPARRISIPTDNTGLKLILYQYPTCPFCCKVRAFLDYYGLSYDVVEVDPVLRQQISWSKYKKVPILLAQREDGTYLQLNDSTLITSVLKTWLLDRNQSLMDIVKFYPTIAYKDEDGNEKTEIQNRYFLMRQEERSGVKKDALVEEVKWRKWADNTLVHVLSPNVYRTRDEAIQSFEWFSEVGEWDKLFPSWERNLIVYAGAYAMYFIGKRLKKRHQLKEEVRESLYDELNTWTRQLKQKGTPFMGGQNPNMADLAVYGVLSSIEGCQAFKDAVQNTNIASWYNSMKALASSHSGSTAVTGR